MLGFGTGISTASLAAVAASEAARQARDAAATVVKLAIVFTSVDYPDLDAIRGAIVDALGDVPIVGGTSGGMVFMAAKAAAPEASTCVRRGITVVVLGGPDIEVDVRYAAVDGDLLDVVAAGEKVRTASEAAEKRGYPHYTSLVFGPGLRLDGDAFIAAVRKGVGERALVAGGFSGDELVLDKPKVFSPDGLRADRAVIAGLFTRHAVGVAGRHGLRAIGPVHTITRSDAKTLIEIDGRPALEVILEDARRVRPDIPLESRAIASHLGRYHPLGMIVQEAGSTKRASDESSDVATELVMRSPHHVNDDGSLLMSAAISEGTRIRVLDVAREGLVEAAVEAAGTAAAVARRGIVGALVLSCAGRLLAEGDQFVEEPMAIAKKLRAPVAGTCVYGEFARNRRDVDAFFNMTTVVVVFAK